MEPRLTLTITGCSHQGEGIGRTSSGQVVFVPYALPGEVVECVVTQTKKDYARGRLLEIHLPAAGRVEPPCKVYYTCGGCHLQHAAYPLQLEIKTRQVAEALSRLGKIQDFLLHPIMAMEEPWRYRHKVHLHPGIIEGAAALGLYREKSHQLLRIPDCLLLPRDMVEVWHILENQLPLSWLNYLQGVVLKKSQATGDQMVAFWTRRWGHPDRRLIAKLIPHRVSTVVQIKSGRESRVLAGTGYIQERLGPLVFRLSATSFFQVNPSQAMELFQRAIAWAGLGGKETVVDVYSGTGTIALFAARQAHKVYGIEVLDEAVEDARINAQHNGLQNVFFLKGKAEEVLPKLIAQEKHIHVIILDPPRQGCQEKVLDAVATCRPHRVVYVSCNPATLARDAARLLFRGYRLAEVQPIDLFPQTHHVECVALFLPIKEKK
ncbi:MAG: 23S rRNA (uracil(1939)-C(5))-methyltransferase RlmD [Moorellaceae bacterium]